MAIAHRIAPDNLITTLKIFHHYSPLLTTETTSTRKALCIQTPVHSKVRLSAILKTQRNCGHGETDGIRSCEVVNINRGNIHKTLRTHNFRYHVMLPKPKFPSDK